MNKEIILEYFLSLALENILTTQECNTINNPSLNEDVNQNNKIKKINLSGSDIDVMSKRIASKFNDVGLEGCDVDKIKSGFIIKPIQGKLKFKNGYYKPVLIYNGKGLVKVQFHKPSGNGDLLELNKVSFQSVTQELDGDFVHYIENKKNNITLTNNTPEEEPSIEVDDSNEKNSSSDVNNINDWVNSKLPKHIDSSDLVNAKENYYVYFIKEKHESGAEIIGLMYYLDDSINRFTLVKVVGKGIENDILDDIKNTAPDNLKYLKNELTNPEDFSGDSDDIDEPKIEEPEYENPGIDEPEYVDNDSESTQELKPLSFDDDENKIPEKIKNKMIHYMDRVLSNDMDVSQAMGEFVGLGVEKLKSMNDELLYKLFSSIKSFKQGYERGKERAIEKNNGKKSQGYLSKVKQNLLNDLERNLTRISRKFTLDESEQYANLLELKKTTYKYGCVMLHYDVPKTWWQKIQDLIDEKDITRVDGVYGREKYPDCHVTILYGLHASADFEEMKEDLGDISCRNIRVENIGYFNGPSYDVVKFDLDYQFLRQMNKALKKQPHTNLHNSYKPHMTIAYVKKGMGKKYAQKLKFHLQKSLRPKNFLYSTKKGDKIKFDIDKKI